MTDIQETKELEEAKAEVRKRKFKKKLLSIAVVVLIILITVVVVWVYGYNAAKNAAEGRIAELENRIEELTNTPVVVNPVTPEIVQGILLGEIKQISELSTAEYAFTNAAKFTESKSIFPLLDWITKKSFIMKWDGSVKAGVKLEGMTVEVVGQTIKVTLPPAEILSYEIDYNSVEVLDEKNNIFNPITVEDTVNFEKETAEALKARAIENGLLEKAKRNTETIITSLLSVSLDSDQEYKIEFVYTEAQ